MRYIKKDIFLVDEKGEKHLVANQISIAQNVFTRFMGLMGQKELPKGCVLMLTPCSSIHMMFMQFPIDVVYVNKALQVVRVVKNIKPWQLDFGHRKALYTLEFPAGTIDFEAKKLILN